MAEVADSKEEAGSEVPVSPDGNRTGCSFMEAAWDKFSCDKSDLDVSSSLGIYLPQKGPAKITDSGHLVLPWRVHLDSCGIQEAGDHCDMSGMCCQVTELDLAHNSITSLQEVLRIIRHMPNLTFLNLTGNPLHWSTIPMATSPVTTATSDTTSAAMDTTTSAADTTSTTETTTTTTDTTSTSTVTTSENNDRCDPALARAPADSDDSQAAGSTEGSHVEVFPTVQQLVLNSTLVHWMGIQRLLSLFPRVEELHLSLNNYSNVDLPDEFTYPSLTHLFFSNEDISAWSQISRLGLAFPNLRHLFLAGTRLASLDEDMSRMSELFPELQTLSLNKTRLSGWEEVEKLCWLPSLSDVRLQGIPFLESLEQLPRRQQLVARLPNVQQLNGSPVTDEERLTAERAFLRLFLDSEDKPDRYYELEEIHGQIDPLAEVNLAPQTVFKVDVVIDERREQIKVNSKLTVRELKKSLQKLAGLPLSQFRLYYNSPMQAGGASRLIYPDKQLYTYNLHDGDEFIIIANLTK